MSALAASRNKDTAVGDLRKAALGTALRLAVGTSRRYCVTVQVTSYGTGCRDTTARGFAESPDSLKFGAVLLCSAGASLSSFTFGRRSVQIS